MSLREVTYYEVACDHPDCDVTTSTLGGDYSAWSDSEAAATDWMSDGVSQVLPDGRAYCEDHRLPTCESCGEPRDDLETTEGYTECADCAGADTSSGGHGA